MGSVKGSALLHVSLWDSGIISVSYTGGPGFQSCNLPFDFFLSLNSKGYHTRNLIGKFQNQPANYRGFYREAMEFSIATSPK